MSATPRTHFARLRRKARRGILVEGAAWLAVAGLVFFVLSYGLDRTLRLEVGYRMALLVCLAAVIARIAWLRFAKPLAVDLHDEELALAVERNDALSKESLITAVQFEQALAGKAQIVESKELMAAHVRDVHARLSAFAFGRAIDTTRVMRASLALVVCLGIGAGWALLDRASVKLWLRRNVLLQAIDWPRRTLLQFADGAREMRVPEGDDLTVRVRAGGVVPEQVQAHFVFDDGERGTEPMTLVGEAEFSVTLQALLHGVRIHADGGDGITEELRVTLVERPRVTDLAVQLVSPAYTGKEPQALAATEGDVRVLRGSRIVLAAKSTKPLMQAQLAFGTDKRQALAVAAGGLSFRGEITPEETGLISIEVLDKDQLAAARAPRLFVRLVDDGAPKVDYRALGVGSMITPHARIPGRVTVRDDFGITTISAGMRIGGGSDAESRPASVPASSASQEVFTEIPMAGLEGFVPGAAEFQNLVLFDLLLLNPEADYASPKNRLRPEQTLSLRFTARDNFAPGAAHQGESETVTFRIVTKDQLIEELQRRQEEQRRDLMQIIEQEKLDLSELTSIISPTANDPRAAQARMRLVAMARAERALGKRTQQIAERYQLILDEMGNNRLLEEGQLRVLESQIVQPLKRIFTEDFPKAADDVAEFAAKGHEDARSSAKAAYESILFRLQQVLKHMAELESLAAVTRDLRELIKHQNDIATEARRRLKAEIDALPGSSSQPSTRKPR